MVVLIINAIVLSITRNLVSTKLFHGSGELERVSMDRESGDIQEYPTQD